MGVRSQSPGTMHVSSINKSNFFLAPPPNFSISFHILSSVGHSQSPWWVEGQDLAHLLDGSGVYPVPCPVG